MAGAGKKDAVKPAPSCGTCPWFVPPREVSEAVKANDFRGVHSFGDCIRFPHSERKRPNEFCGEHPSFKEK